MASSSSSVPRTMKAVQIARHGGVDVLECRDDVPVPVPAAGEVLVRNHFAGVNFIDTYFRSGLYAAPSLPLTLGREAAGEVVGAGPAVGSGGVDSGVDSGPGPGPGSGEGSGSGPGSGQGIPVPPNGTRVVYMADTGAGTYAQYTAVPAARLVALPDGLAADAAAAVLLQGLTAWTFVREAAAVAPGAWALVHAAAGGVGLLLVQMLRLAGARVVAAAGSDDKRELARRAGAAWTVDSRADDLVARVLDLTGGRGVDVIFDGVGKATFDADLEMIAPKGLLISYGNASGAVPPVSILRLAPKNVKLMRPMVSVYVDERDDLVRYTSELFDLVASGKINVAIHGVYPLEDAARAHTDIESRKTTGKLLLDCR